MPDEDEPPRLPPDPNFVRRGRLAELGVEIGPVLVALTPVTTFFIVTLVVIENGTSAELAFFRVAATIIPTLVLTLAVQARFFAQPVKRTRSSRSQHWMRVVTVRMAVSSSSAPGLAKTSIVAGSIASGFAAIALAAFIPTSD